MEEQQDQVPVLEDGSLRLRAPRPEDREDRIAAGVDADFLRGLAGSPSQRRARLTEEAADHWYRRQRDGAHWVIQWGGHAVGNAGFSHLDAEHRNAIYHLALWAAPARGRGVGTAATRLILRYAFDTLHLHRVALRVLETNTRAIRCYRRCGFQEEGIEAETALVDGQWVNDLRMRILEHEYRDSPSQGSPAAAR